MLTSSERRLAPLMRSLVLPLFLMTLLSLGGCSSWKNMDVANPNWKFDDNVIPKNPVWGTKVLNANNPIPTPSNFCPTTSQDPTQWIASPTCTGQAVHYDGPTQGCSGGHLNYFAVNYEGSLYWQDFSGPWYHGGDDDYNFLLRRNDQALYSTAWPNDAIGPEFDSDETVDDWDDTNTWWDNFHHNIVDKDAALATATLNGQYSIVIGLAALDCEHDCHTELHPVYAMFIHIKDDPSDDQWAFFIRNWGDEGWCSNNQEYLNDNAILGSKTLKIRIPHAGFTDVAVIKWNVWSSASNPSVTEQKEPDGALFTFQLDDPSSQSWYVGDVSFQWTNNGRPAPPRNDFKQNPPGGATSPLRSADVNRVDRGLDGIPDKIKRLNPVSQKDLVDKLSQMRPPVNKHKVSSPKITVEPPAAAPPKKTDFGNTITQAPNTARLEQRKKLIVFITEYLRKMGIQ